MCHRGRGGNFWHVALILSPVATFYPSKIQLLSLFCLNSMFYCFAHLFLGGFYMGLKWSFINYPPRKCVIMAIKSASGYDLPMHDADSSSKKSWWRQSGCQPLSHHDFIRPMSPHFYSNTPFYRGASHGLGRYGLAVGCFISANFTTGRRIDKAAARGPGVH